ncbi:MAG: tetraacyldisaccharide 4'-kinase [Candidatus Delongbacteria bacterium]|nr:tetraacyldisaccharide 4'-kinase [Candidatus Delongbacteria bacterium]MBN2836580.1 tetraacyldisaccharide 4'-kinase [Candidatus Delongbacteria bacterium]
MIKKVLSILFEIIIKARHFLYDNCILKSLKHNIPIISIGNISVGGTGKSPHVIKLVKEFSAAGKKVAVISRGYKKKQKGLVVVHDGNGKFSTPESGGDEPFMIAKSTNAIVISSPDRNFALEYLKNNYYVDLVVLDDGFQHRKIDRNFDIVLVDSVRFLGNRKVLPSGILRDTITRLHFADLIILTKIENIDSSIATNEYNELKKFNKPVLFSEYKYLSLMNSHGESLDLNKIDESEIFLFTGIAMPDTFFNRFKYVKNDCRQIFDDHHRFTEKEIQKIIKASNAKNKKLIVCTEKDFVNIPVPVDERIYYLKMDVNIFNENGKIDILDLVRI